MLELDKIFKVDPELEVNGRWFKVGKDAQVLVAARGNPKFVELYERLVGPYEAQIASGQMDNDLYKEVMAEVLARTVLLDWQGVGFSKEEGEIKYSVEAAKKVLLNPLYRGFRKLVLDWAGNLENFRRQEQEETLKNS